MKAQERMIVESERAAPKPEGDYSALWLLLILGAVEVALLYVLIAVETPATPLVRQLMRNAFGIFSLVMGIVTLLCVGMALLLGARERAAARLAAGASPAEKL